MRHDQGWVGEELDETWDTTCAYENSKFCTRGRLTNRTQSTQWFANWRTNAAASEKVILFDSEHQGYHQSAGCSEEFKWARTSPDSPGCLRVGRHIDEGWSAAEIAEKILHQLGS